LVYHYYDPVFVNAVPKHAINEEWLAKRIVFPGEVIAQMDYIIRNSYLKKAVKFIVVEWIC
jgi:hypothetical protein